MPSEPPSLSVGKPGEGVHHEWAGQRTAKKGSTLHRCLPQNASSFAEPRIALVRLL